MSRVLWLPILGLAGLLAMTMASDARAQAKPYIGFVYPAGGQQGTTFQVKLGGQRLNGVADAIVSGTGVSAKVVRYYRKLSNQEVTLLRQQLQELKRGTAKKWMRKKGAGKKGAGKEGGAKKGGAKKGWAKKGAAMKDTAKMSAGMMGAGMMGAAKKGAAKKNEATLKLIERIEKRIAAWVRRPACSSLSSLVFVEVTAAADAKPGARELRLTTSRGVSNPLVFHIGQVPEISRRPMKTSPFQVLGKERLALRKRPAGEEEVSIAVPCTMNGQIAPGEVNRYRFEARKGQRLVISSAARQLIPYIADAVPGWFQPVLTLRDAAGKEVAYNDDYRFKPDPTLYYEVPKDGEYVLTINDALYRGREDFVYRITIGEVPFVTSIFPLGAAVDAAAKIEMKGWNLETAKLTPPPEGAGPGIHRITAKKKGFVSNSLPFALDKLPECFDKESNNDQSRAQKVKLPMIVNGRMDREGDWDVFQIEGRAGDTIVAEVYARRLESPMDSTLKLTDASGKLLAFNDDHQDPESGLNTHHADSYLMAKLPADGTYYVHLGDTSRNGGEAYAYRLRISAPQPDFALRVVPSSGGLRGKGATAAKVYVVRKDGFTGPIKLRLKNPPTGFRTRKVTLPKGKEMVRFGVKTNLVATKKPINLIVEGRAMIHQREVVHEAVPADDRMQAFLWRHLVPAKELKVLVYNPSYKPPPKRVPRVRAPAPVKKTVKKPVKKTPPAASASPPAGKPKFTKRQVAGRLRQLKNLYEEWLLTDDFYNRKVAECEDAI